MLKEDGSKAIINGWERSGIFEVVTDGSSALSSIDSFQDIAPLASINDRGNKIVYLTEINEDFVNFADLLMTNLIGEVSKMMSST